MRFDPQTSFPYPVLRTKFVDDYIDGDFQATIQYEKTADDLNVRVHVAFALSVAEIQNEIAAERAKFALVIKCRDTYFRKCVLTKNRSHTVTISSGELRGEVVAQPYVIATKDIKSFRCKLINPEFGKGPFEFAAGELLAMDGDHVEYIDRDYFKPVSSVIVLATKEELKGWDWGISLDDTSGKIMIFVSAEAKQSIDDARNNVRNLAVLLNSLYFVTCTHALTALKYTEEEYADRKWAKVFKAQCLHKGLKYKDEEPFWVTQQLLDNPLRQLHEYVFKGE